MFKKTISVPTYPALGPCGFWALVAFTALTAGGCSTGNGDADAGGPDLSTPPDMTVPGAVTGPRSTLTDTAAATARTNCMFKSGDLPAVSQGADALLGPQIPIDNVIVLMMENRSLDHLYANLKSYGQTDADVAIMGVSEVDGDGSMVSTYHDSALCFADTNHSWAGAHTEYDNGLNDGFALANANTEGLVSGKRGLSYYTETDIPFMYELANRYTIADRYFSSVLGPTWPNRYYLYAATSFGETDNVFVTGNRATMFGSMTQANLNWHVYWSTAPGSAILLETTGFGNYYQTNFDSTDLFFQKLAAGTLENVVFLDPDMKNEDGGGSDFHPPGDVQEAEQFVAKVVNAVTQSPQWPHTALFITFDENGGLYDHVPPPQACPPDNIPPILAPTDPVAKFDRYGFRVPLIVVSPYAKPHAVAHHVYDHTSILRFIESRFSLPALTARDANADPLTDAFDFTTPALLTPPTLPAAPLDQTRYNACVALYPTGGPAVTPDGGSVDGGSVDGGIGDGRGE